MTRIGREQVERAARVYASNKDACRALGIALHTFGRLCRRYDVESPYARRRRRLDECRQDYSIEE